MREAGKAPQALEDTQENRMQQARKLLTFFSRSGFAEKINSQEDKSRFVKNLSLEEVESILERINGIILGIPIGQRAVYEFPGLMVDPETGKPFRLPSPPPMQRHILGEVVLPGIKGLSPDDVPEVLATEISLLHMFQDGNGRLARIVYLLTKAGFKVDESEDSVSLMTKYLTQREGVVNCDPSFIEEELMDLIFYASHVKDSKVFQVHNIINIPDDVPDMSMRENSEVYRNSSPTEQLMMLTQYRYSVEPFDTFIALRETMFLRMGRDAQIFLVPEENNTYAIDVRKLISSLRTREDFGCLLSGFEYPKKKRAQLILDIYKNPDRFPSRVPGITIKQYYQNKIMENAINV